MKHLLLTLLIVLSSTYGFAKDAEVILTRFYTQEEHSIIPDKTCLLYTSDAADDLRV